MTGVKTCSQCDQTKHLPRFRKIGPDRWHPWCKDCESARAGQRATGSTLHIGNDLAERISEAADLAGVSPSWLARKLITEGLDDVRGPTVGVGLIGRGRTRATRGARRRNR